MNRMSLWWFLVAVMVFSLVVPAGAFAEQSNTGEEEEETEEMVSPPFAPGDENKEIKLMKQDLTKLGFGSFPAEPSERYGAVTKGVVTDFQEFYQINATEIGIADELTLQVIAELLASPFQDRFEGDGVADLKISLTKLGFGTFPQHPSPVYGAITARVVKEFQTANSLPASGIAEVSTLQKIEQLLERLPQVPYRDGQAGEEIVTLKENLTTLGFGSFPSSPSDRYGQVTSSVVASFQEYFGLEASGEADQATLDLLENILTSVYTDGTEDNEEVRQLKLDLTALGFGTFPADPSGNYGPVTMRVVAEYQNANDLRISGIADPVTLAFIAAQIEEANRPLEVPYQDGDAGEEIITMKKNLTTLGFGTFPSSPSDRYGQVTSSVIASFQEYFSLQVEVIGEADQITLDYIGSILNSVYTDGVTGEDAVKELKEKLTQLGYGTFPANPSGNYGPITMRVVSEFQAANDLIASGIADPVTLALVQTQVEELNRPLEVPYQDGDAGEEIVTLKENLKKLGFGSFPASPSDRFGPVTTNVVAQFQAYFGLDVAVEGAADQQTLDAIQYILTSVYTDGTEDNADVKQLKLDLTALGFGTFPANPSGNYGPITMRVVSDYQAANQLKISGIADPVTLALIAQQIAALPEPEQEEAIEAPENEAGNGGEEDPARPEEPAVNPEEGSDPENTDGNGNSDENGNENENGNGNEEKELNQEKENGDENQENIADPEESDSGTGENGENSDTDEQIVESPVLLSIGEEESNLALNEFHTSLENGLEVKMISSEAHEINDELYTYMFDYALKNEGEAAVGGGHFVVVFADGEVYTHEVAVVEEGATFTDRFELDMSYENLPEFVAYVSEAAEEGSFEEALRWGIFSAE